MKASLSSAQPASPRAQKLNRARLKFLVNNLMMSIALVKKDTAKKMGMGKVGSEKNDLFSHDSR
jgi:hypothetical protein